MSIFATNTFILPRILKIVAIFLLVCGLGVYVTYQARNFLQGPSITLQGEYTAVQHEDTITLTGQAKNIVKLTLNGKEIHTDAEGAFTHKLSLEHGYSIVSLNAQDRFGRTTSLVREYVYVPE
jgi:hypothetical protein